MASTKVRGITIELGADTSGLSKALKGVNSEIGKTQKDLKDVERLLKLDPKNTELLEQKQRLLNDRIQETTTKLDALKQAQAQIDLSTDEGQRQYDALTREIVSCEQELKKAQKQSDSFNVSLEKVSVTAKDLSRKFENLADKTRVLSTAAGGVLLSMGGLAVKSAQNADELNTLSKQTGIATDELQKMQYAADLIDVPVDTITNSLRKLKKNITSTSSETTAAWDKLNITLKDTDGQYRNITDIFYDTVGALGEVSNETERDILAMQLFGKSADELAGIIDDGGAALKQLGIEAENLGVIIPEEELNKANEFNDALDRLKAESMGTFAQLGNEIAEMLLPYLPQLQQFLQDILATIRNLNPETLKAVAAFLGITATLSPLFKMLSVVTGSFSTLIKTIGGLSGPVLAVIAVIGVLVAAIVTLWNTNEDFRNNVIQTWNRIKSEFDRFGNGIVQRLNEMGFEFKNFSEVVSAIWKAFSNSLAPPLTDALRFIETQLDGFFDFITGLFDVFAGIFTNDWSRVWNGIKEIFVGVFQSLVSYARGPLNDIISMVNEAIGVVNNLIEKINRVKVFGWSPNISSIGNIPLMAQGGVVSSGSAIVGEAGAELLTVSGGRAMVQPLGGQSGTSELTDLLETYLPYLAERQNILLDGGVLVGQTANAMNDALGSIRARSARR